MGRPRDAVRASRMRSRGGGVARARARVALFLLLAALAPPAVAPLEVDAARKTPEEGRAVLERAFPGVFPDARAGDGSADAEGGARERAREACPRFRADAWAPSANPTSAIARSSGGCVNRRRAVRRRRRRRP